MSEECADASLPVAPLERRYSHRLRSVFDMAYAMIEPFFDAESGWRGHPLQHLSWRMVRDNFPELTSEEVRVLVIAAHRTYIEHCPQGSDHLARPAELRSAPLCNEHGQT